MRRWAWSIAALFAVLLSLTLVAFGHSSAARAAITIPSVTTATPGQAPDLHVAAQPLREQASPGRPDAGRPALRDLAGQPRSDAKTRSAGVAAEAGTSGGAAAVRLGQAGEDAVRGAYDIGPKFTADIGGRTRIFDGLSNEAVSEVKNVASQAYTQQLKDSLAYAQGNGLRFDLYVRPDTYLTGPLRDAISGGFINLRYIP